MTETAELGKDFLAHAGVLGMKWGKRKSPEQIAKERKAKDDAQADNILAKNDLLNKDISELKSIKTDKASTKRNILKNISELEARKAKNIADAENARNGKLTNDEKKIIIGGALVAGFIASKITRTNLESGAFRRLASKGATFIASKGKTTIAFKQNNDLAHAAMNVDDIMKKVVGPINPKYGGIGTKMNCRRATMAYEMRRRGNDVMATRTTKAYGQNAVGLRNVLNPGKKAQPAGPYGAMGVLFKEQKNFINTPTSAITLSKNFAAGARKPIEKSDALGTTKSYLDDIFDALSAEPNGSRGELAVKWGMGGGHSMAYEVVNNKAVIIDAQRNIKFESPLDLIADYKKQLSEDASAAALKKIGLKISDLVTDNGSGVISSSGFTRLDNIDLNTDYLQRWIRNAS